MSRGSPVCRAMLAKGSRTKPAILSSETERIRAFTGSVCSTETMKYI
jgi:hypothetical protein